MAYASRKTFVTVERIVDHRLLDDELTAAGVLPAIYVDGVAKAEKGAWPYGLWGEYTPDTAELQRYAQMARTEEGFKQWLAEVYA
jgi:glutaconate CoA-transferase subunit A